MPTLRRKARRLLKNKHGVVIKLDDVDRIWKQWIKYYVIRELIDKGKVRLDNKMTLEIVGSKVADDKKLYAIFVRGIGMKKGVKQRSANLQKGRNGFVYHIVLTDKNFREGKLIYTPAKGIKKAVYNALVNTNNYYRIVA